LSCISFFKVSALGGHFTAEVPQIMTLVNGDVQTCAQHGIWLTGWTLAHEILIETISLGYEIYSDEDLELSNILCNFMRDKSLAYFP
jgi:hypothetical protein